MAKKKDVFNVPNFQKRREKLQPVTFVPVLQVFKPVIQVKALQDVSGWADTSKRVKWAMKTGRLYMLDEDKAREFMVKGYVEIVNGTVKPVSTDERAEILSSVTRIGTGNTPPPPQ